MIKKTFYIIFILNLFFFFPSLVSAGNDLQVLCHDTDCQTTPANTPLFSESDIKPGMNFYQNINITNDNNSDVCDLYFSAEEVGDSILKPVLLNKISRNSSNLYFGSMADLFNSPSPIYLDSIPAGSSYTYVWKTTMDENAGNQYQGKILTFDLSLDFYCGQPPVPTATPTPASPPPPNPPSGCTASVPATPLNLVATPLSPTRVQLNWIAVDPPFTHYLVAFGPALGDYRWGNPNIGFDNNYVVGSLTPGAQYCFYVRAVNDCMPGLASDPVCVNVGSPIVPVEIIPPGFQPGVLGETTEESLEPSPDISPDSSGDVAGLSDSCSRYWLPLLWLLALLINLLSYYHQIEKHQNRRSSYFHLWPFFVSLFTYLIDGYLLKTRCCLIFPPYCQYFYLAHLFSFLIPWYYYHKRAK